MPRGVTVRALLARRGAGAHGRVVAGGLGAAHRGRAALLGGAGKRAIALVQDLARVDRPVASQVVAYLGAAAPSSDPCRRTERFVFERFFDEAGGMQLVVHSPFGGRVNRALGLALRKRFCGTFDFELQAAASDDAVVLSLGPQHSFPLEEVLGFLSPATVRDTLDQAVLASPMFASRWRWNLTRSLVPPALPGGAALRPPSSAWRPTT